MGASPTPLLESLIESGRYPLLTRVLFDARAPHDPDRLKHGFDLGLERSARWSRDDAPRIAHLRRAVRISLAAAITLNQGNRRRAPTSLAKPIASRDFWSVAQAIPRRGRCSPHDLAATTGQNDARAVAEGGLRQQDADRPAPRQ